MGCTGTAKVRTSYRSSRLLIEGVDDSLYPLGRIIGPEGESNLTREEFLAGQVEILKGDDSVAFLKEKIKESQIERF